MRFHIFCASVSHSHHADAITSFSILLPLIAADIAAIALPPLFALIFS
jgi:hypothetical protein